MENNDTQQAKAIAFKALHQGDEMLIIPNIWDPLGARLLESLGYPAIATASASVALTHGYDDGEQIPLDDALTRITEITRIVKVPVSADFESAYAGNDVQLQRNVELLLQTGVVGLNFEDYNARTSSLYPADVQCKRIKVIRKTAEAAGIPFFINARTDVYIRGNLYPLHERLEETIARGKAYLDAGGDCFFPPGMKDKDELFKLIQTLKSPVNVIAIPGIPDFETMKQIGVARLSLGPGYLKIAIKAMKDLALKLKGHDGLTDVLQNDVTSEHLKKLVKNA
jgi:2-methylisocitrate lyase-like PEP mutase family enzyme